MAVILETQDWAKQQFGTCRLGDARRTRRLVRFAAQVAAAPDASTPGQTEKWSDLKAAYRLIDNERVTFDAIAEPHWQQTRQQSTGTWLISCETTEVEFGATNTATGLGPLGGGFGRGFLLHSGLMIDPASEAVIANRMCGENSLIKSAHLPQAFVSSTSVIGARIISRSIASCC